MPDDRGRLFADEVAAKVGIGVSDWRARVSRGFAPGAADRVLHAGSVRSVWNPATIDEYLKERSARITARQPDAGEVGTYCSACLAVHPRDAHGATQP
jgi:hypothetical protein